MMETISSHLCNPFDRNHSNQTMELEETFTKCLGVSILAVIGLIFLPPMAGICDGRGLLGQLGSTIIELYPILGRFVLQFLLVMFFVFPLVMVFFMALSLLISFILFHYDRALGRGIGRAIREDVDYRDKY
ncbi:hypothetical protein BO94DRAFT_266884 [Aspergillus sclerotioniger CBS 115572]|uniref:Uncharacterized protein n=1 Tax=Aspergillus sclerotioniger CBS 115572 TaxID=1450535 RepID=A0A317VC63_9EURO|nr:hypothetical protein BO94DRAFT_266884 [Aspergillus sclerotioniger CBS 115572]PWY70831.1 hypothetical protein BO94DRAFT_266884 [Aspergillus sclerotioniger CBS 115572]